MPDTLRHECRLFTRYLLDTEATEYICERYVAAHRERWEVRDPVGFDAALIRFARRNRITTRIADSYCALFRRHAPLRQKLVLLLAILETTAPSASVLDAADGSTATVVSGIGRAIVFALWALAGVIILTPIRALHPRGRD